MNASRTRLAALAASLLLPAGAAGQAAGGSGGLNAPSQQQKPYVVLVSFDGLGADLLGRLDTPNFQRVIRQGARSHSLVPVFPSLTFPSHCSIVTGMYPERHGIVGMSFFDPSRGETFSYQDSSAVDGSWYRGEPIWVTAEKQGMVTATCFWPGSEAAIQGIRPSYWKKYDASLPNEARVDAVLEWLRLPAARRPHLVTLFFHEVDGAGHRFGADSPEVKAAVARVDQALGRLLDGIESLPFAQDVFVVLVSDHGMANVTKEQTVPMESLIDVEGLKRQGAGSQMSLWVDGDAGRARAMRDAINSRLQHGRAYLREEIPAALHYRSDPRIGDVVILMEEPWRVLPPKGGTRDMTVLAGWHGWAPSSPSMHGIFLAMGPRIRRASEIPSFESIHIYPFLAEALGLEPAAGIDGQRDWLRRLLTSASAPSARPLAFLNANFVDVVRGDVQSGQTVLTSDGRITGIGPAGAINVPPDAIRIPAQGRYLIPGLWDMHVHLRSAAVPRTGKRAGAPLKQENASMLGLFLPHGIVGIREMGGDLADSVLRWREEIRSGDREGPRILTAGRKIDGDPPTWPGSLPVKEPQEAREAVRKMKAAGADFIKVNFNEARPRAVIGKGTKRTHPAVTPLFWLS